MGKFKDFKTAIRKKIGMTGVAEFVNDAIAANSKKNWDNWFSNDKFLKEYATPKRIASYREVIYELEEMGAFLNVKTVLDVGCGTGHFLSELHKLHPSLKLYGSDFSEESVKISKNALPNAEFFILDVYNITPDFNEKYDLVICSEVLEHLLQPEEALKNIFSLLSENGKLVLAVPNGRIDTYGGHINFWSPESWKVFVENTLHLQTDQMLSKKTIVKFKSFNNNRNLSCYIFLA